jgi:hypothetical protein
MRRLSLIGLFSACLLPLNWASAQDSIEQVLEAIVLEYTQPVCRYIERTNWAGRDCSARPDYMECAKHGLGWSFTGWELRIILNQLKESNRHYEMVLIPEYEGRVNEYIDKIYLDTLYEMFDYCMPG